MDLIWEPEKKSFMKLVIIIFLVFIASIAPKPISCQEVFPDKNKGIERVSNGATFRQYYFYFIASNYQNSKQSNTTIDSFANAIITKTSFS